MNHTPTQEFTINELADRHAAKYMFGHEETARESFKEGAKLREGWETAFEACNEERKKIRDDFDKSCAEYSKLEKELTNLQLEVKTLREENEKLCSVMIAAAEEIQDHWKAHCDDEGYGPSNLMHRLEKGIPSQYGYTAGAFDRLDKELKAVTLANAEAYNAGMMAERILVESELTALTASHENLYEALKGWNERGIIPEDDPIIIPTFEALATAEKLIKP